MICPHCHSEIPDGSNICPLCFSSLNGVKNDSGAAAAQPHASGRSASADSPAPVVSRPKGQRKHKKKKNYAPMIIAVGLIVILAVIIVLIVRSMFIGGTFFSGGNTPKVQENTPEPEQTVETSNLIFYGQEPTAAPVVITPIPAIEVTPTPAPTDEPVARTYKTLKKGDNGSEVVLLQQALAQLGLLTSAADGIYGTGTMTAVRTFQEQNGLDVDGIAGSKTQELLFTMSPVTQTVDSTAAPGEILDLPG